MNGPRPHMTFSSEDPARSTGPLPLTRSEIEAARASQARREALLRQLGKNLQLTRRAGPSLTLVLGAGVSLGAGVPLGKGWVPLLWRFIVTGTVEKDHVSRVLDVQRDKSFGYRAYGADFTDFAERAQRETAGYELAWLEGHPENYSSEYTALMESLEPDHQQAFVSALLDACALKITWPYIRIAQLVRERWVDTILTTNLDLVLIETLSLFGIYPAICDFHEAAVLRSSRPAQPQIIYLHGNRNSYNVRNTGPSVKAYGEQMRALLVALLKERTFLVSGYSGWEDGFMHILRAHYQSVGGTPSKDLYWAHRGASSKIPAIDPTASSRVYDLEFSPAERLFEDLAAVLKLGSPHLLANPVQFFIDLLKKIDPEAPETRAFNLESTISRIESSVATQISEDPGVQIVAAVRDLREAEATRLAQSWIATHANISRAQLSSLLDVLRDVSADQRPIARKAVLAIVDAMLQSPVYSGSREMLRVISPHLDQLGGSTRLLESREAAIEVFQHAVALHALRARLEPDGQVAPIDRVTTFLQLGDLLTESARYEEALAAFRSAGDIVLSLGQADADSAFTRVMQAATLYKVARTLTLLGRLDEALLVRKQIREIWSELKDTNRARTEFVKEYAYELTHIAEIQGQIAANQNRPSEGAAAAETYREAIECFEALLEARPCDLQISNSYFAASILLSKVPHQDQRPEPLQRAFDRALQCAQKTDALLFWRAAASLGLQLVNQRGDPHDAESAKLALERVIELEPNSNEWKHQLGNLKARFF